MNKIELVDAKRWVNVFANLTTLLFILSVVFLLLFGTPTSLQRLGAFWIGIIVFFLGMIRLVSEKIRTASHGSGEYGEVYNEKIGKYLIERRSEDYSLLAQALKRQERGRLTHNEVRGAIEDLDEHISSNVLPTELVIVALATLLTGFGDMLYCLFRSAGHFACSS